MAWDEGRKKRGLFQTTFTSKQGLHPSQGKICFWLFFCFFSGTILKLTWWCVETKWCGGTKWLHHTNFRGFPKCSSRRDSHGGETSAGRAIQRKKCRLPRNFSWRTIRHPNPPRIAVQIGGLAGISWLESFYSQNLPISWFPVLMIFRLLKVLGKSCFDMFLDYM